MEHASNISLDKAIAWTSGLRKPAEGFLKRLAQTLDKAASQMQSSTPHRGRETSDNVGERFQSVWIRSVSLGVGL